MNHEQAGRLADAEDSILEAVAAYRRLLADLPMLEAAPIAYAPSTVLGDAHRYAIEPVNTAHPYRQDAGFVRAATAEMPGLQALLLSFSPRWEDRIRAEALSTSLRSEITLPDGFPCIYEPADSPRKQGRGCAKDLVWVASPDEAMLSELLPLYRELWSAYESQWPSSPNRAFEVGRLNGLSARGIYRPGTTPADVIGQTMLTHSDMYRTAPSRLREMHPLHAQWTTSRASAAAQQQRTLKEAGDQR